MNVTEAQRWLRFAREDLLVATAMLGNSDAYPRHACWLAQQAAEKTLKAALVFLEIEFPFSHDLDRLRDILPAGWSVKTKCPDLAELSEWATEARYPGDTLEAVEVDAQTAVRQARQVWEVISLDLKQRGLTVPTV